MSMFENLKKKIGIEKKEKNKSRTEEIMAQRDTIKKNLAVKLYKRGCSDEEVEEVLSIIQSAEDDIAVIKNSLIGTNINPPEDDPMKPLLDGQEAIKKRQLEMQEELNNAIRRILSGK